MSEEYRKFDAADYINAEEDARGLLRAAMDEDAGDGAVLRATLKHVARTHNISALACETGLNRGNLYEALSEDGNPTLATLMKVTRALGLRLRLEPVEGLTQGAQPAERRHLPAGSKANAQRRF
ncbi:MAG: putative addiction module antidote protein [Chloroflexi bacterium]|nr:putative addiction module antidote protein [Chloroflexota bacterium]